MSLPHRLDVTVHTVTRKLIEFAVASVAERLARSMRSRQDMNRRTAEIHPDPEVQRDARTRIDAYETAIEDLGRLCDGDLGSIARETGRRFAQWVEVEDPEDPAPQEPLGGVRSDPRSAPDDPCYRGDGSD